MMINYKTVLILNDLPPSGRLILYNLHGNQTFNVGWVYFNILSIIFLLAFVTAMVSIEER